MRWWRQWVGIVLGLMLGGCATVPLAPLALDHAAKQFQRLPDQGQLYIVRSFGPGTAILFQVVVDGKVIGGIAPRTYFLLPLSPGAHTVAAFSGGSQGMLPLTVEAGRNYFMQVTTPRLV